MDARDTRAAAVGTPLSEITETPTVTDTAATSLPDEATSRELERLDGTLTAGIVQLDKRTDLILHAQKHLATRDARINALDVRLAALEDGFLAKYRRKLGASL
jgi:hypothetical protein